MTLDRRTAGVLLHPTSLPGPHGSGDLGPAAYHFVDWLGLAGQGAWQVLPLSPIGAGGSPYSSVSAFAGSPLLVALEPLVQKGWLAPIDGDAAHAINPPAIDYARVIPFRMGQLRAAAAGFFAQGTTTEHDALHAYCEAQRDWLDDYALFMAISEADEARHGWRAWPHWEAPLARRDPAALAAARKQLAEPLRFWQFVQWCFAWQWAELKDYANARGVRLIGDLPIFVAHHSADCWSRPDLYLLDEHRMPAVVAGVPPDYFSETGQRWGNPLYNWARMAAERYTWWVARMRRQLELADMVRVDHFRGFAAYWEIPASHPTAVKGRWVPAPGAELFQTLIGELGKLPLIAEDLGIITPDVEALRDQFGLPGMRVLQFAFSGDADHYFLPHNHVPNCVAYTGTHDNDTVNGWWETTTAHERGFAAAYLNTDGRDVNWAMIRAGSASPARLFICQLQDVLGLGSAHRMNMPGQGGCWTWRFDWPQMPADAAQRLARISAAYGRCRIDALQLPPYPADLPIP